MANKISKIISVAVATAAIAVMVGWIMDIPVLKSILPQFVSMKFTTAVCFLMSAVVLFCAVKISEEERGNEMILIFVSFIILLIMTSLIISIFTGIKTGLEDLIVREAPGAIATPVPGRPALVTMINFVLIAGIGLLSVLKKNGTLPITPVLGVIVAGIGVLAIIGYVFNFPFLYGNFNNVSSAVALHTAILFVLLGVGFSVIHGKRA